MRERERAKDVMRKRAKHERAREPSMRERLG